MLAETLDLLKYRLLILQQFPISQMEIDVFKQPVQKKPGSLL